MREPPRTFIEQIRAEHADWERRQHRQLWMTSLAEFLLARIAEDEALADRSVQVGTEGAQMVSLGSPDAPAVLLMHPARVMAECEAKRRIVERAAGDIAKADARDPEQIERSFNAGAAFFAHNTLLDLALAYADHPDYREEWRP